MFQGLILSLALLNTSLAQSPEIYAPGSTFAQAAVQNSTGFDRTYELRFHNPVQDKNFYLLSLFQRHPEVGRLLRQDALLRKLSNEKVRALRMAATCNDMDCFDRLFRISDPTIETVAIQLKSLSRQPEFKRLIMKDMRPSGVFIKYGRQSDSEMLVAAWKDAANGMNRLLRVYALGKDPFYKNIDRVSFDVSSEEYRELLKTNLRRSRSPKDRSSLNPHSTLL